MVIYDFRKDSPDFVPMISAGAGIIPDYSQERLDILRGKDVEAKTEARVGLFADDMPQNIVTRVYNYNLDYVLLCGEESPVMIDNLKRTLIPDIQPDIKVLKFRGEVEANALEVFLSHL
ncbi:MAG: hypothetical protein IJV13_02345 [Prevotella sp.]|nr:hypothetical protein [Prevotella sp.]MBQ9651040.1 hypothetical protein [Prevotella sp.]